MFKRWRQSNDTKLLNEYRRLELENKNLRDQLEYHKNTAFEYQKLYNGLAERIEGLCMMLLDNEYARKQLGGTNTVSNMNIHQLISYAEEQYKKRHIDERNLLTDLTKQLDKKEYEIESLEAQLSRYLIQKQHAEKYSSDNLTFETNLGDDVVEDKEMQEDQKTKAQRKENKAPASVATAIIGEEDDLVMMPTSSAGSIGQNKPQKFDADKGNNRSRGTLPRKNTLQKIGASNGNELRDIKAHIVNLNDYMNKMTDVMWGIMIAIGAKGLSESKDIKKIIIQSGVTESAFNTSLAQLRKMNIIEQEKISTGWRWFHAYELSDIGDRIYLEKYKQSPVICEKQVLKKEHTTALHGYCIKDTADILRAVFGYEETSTRRKENSTKLYTGETYIPDVVAKSNNGGIVDYFEVELGHHSQKDFNKKCDKMRMVTKDLYFVVPDANIMNRVLAKQIGQWTLEKGGKSKLKGTAIYLTTLTKLNNKKWEIVYSFD